MRSIALLVTALAIAALFPRASAVEPRYEVGSVWSGDTVRALFAFPIYVDDATIQREMEQKESQVLPVFVPSGITPGSIRDSLGMLVGRIATATERPAMLGESVWRIVGGIPAGEPRAEALRGVAGILAEELAGPYRAGVLDRAKGQVAKERISVRRAGVLEDEVPVTMLYDSVSLAHLLEAGLTRRVPPDQLALALDLFSAVYRPTLLYSPTLTAEAREAARASVRRSRAIVPEGAVIVATGEKITENIRQKLESYQGSRKAHDIVDNPWRQYLGSLGHVALMMGLGLLYLYNFRRRIFYDNLQLGIILVAHLLMAVLAFVTQLMHTSLPVEFLILIPFLSMLLAILFDSRTAFYQTVVACFIVAGIRGNDYTFAIASLTAGVLAAYTVRDIKSRTQLFRSIAYSFLGYATAISALALERGDSLTVTLLRLGFAAINATVSPVLTFGVIFLIEKFFGVATDLKLLEYDNLNHPLLRALADKAPGTYQHTLTIARLAESAAVAIGANALLAKVGSYFHDVGKLAKSEYFVENQMEMGNKHDKITPEKSARMIRNHVLDGIELAREYKLPQRIVDFIPMHHGTTVIQYFLDKARSINPDVDENDFRYPGPLPQSRETAIVMLADAVEATTRSLPSTSPKSIEDTIDRVIKKRFTEGQLDQCELTLADLTKIKVAFTKNLIGMNHPRIQYKDDEKEQAKGAEEERRGKGSPTIPYVDDAFGNIDIEVAYGRPGERKGKDKKGPE